MELVESCDPKDEKEIDKILKNFKPKTADGVEMTEVLASELGIDKIVAVEVDHCPQSYACLLISAGHGNIIYSGDTLPCQNLLNYGKNVRVLIHEATL